MFYVLKITLISRRSDLNVKQSLKMPLTYYKLYGKVEKN